MTAGVALAVDDSELSESESEASELASSLVSAGVTGVVGAEGAIPDQLVQIEGQAVPDDGLRWPPRPVAGA